MPNSLELLLMPGMDGTGEMFAPLVDAIKTTAPATKIHILRYPRDQPLDYAQLLEYALTKLPDAPCAVIAESFSGPIAIKLAARFPSQIERVVLSTSFVRNPLPWLALIAPMLDFLPLAQAPDWLLEQQLFNGHATPELKLALARATASVSPAAMRVRLKAIFSVDAGKCLSQLSQPLLYLQADADRLVPDRCAQEIKTALAHVSIRRLAGPHCLLQIAPARAWQEIQSWL